jgi:N6-L-threonylcarbamoyladenine synthase
MIWLGLETSCDDTSVAIVKDGTDMLCNLISSQVTLHEKFGGVVPELASRKHLEMLNPLIEEALENARLSWKDIGGVAVSNGPGLVGSLLVGVAVAKTCAGFLCRPLLGMNHLEGHIYANFLAFPSIALPSMCLLVSGGHTILMMMHGHGDLEALGETRDDAAGECFDKGGRILGLPYPAGPVIDRESQGGNERAVRFPRAHLQGSPFEFSFSGLKTAVLNFVKSGGMERHPLNDICASFQAAIVDVLVEKTLKALKEKKQNSLMLAGGVACNTSLRRKFEKAAQEHNFSLFFPPPLLCTDNAAMIACSAHYAYERGYRCTLALDVHPNLGIGAMKK